MRQLPIPNFRDLHGYANINGQTMKKNMIFRGGPLHQVSQDDIKYMEEELHIRHILDYRDEKEAELHADAVFSKADYQRISALRVQGEKDGTFDFGSILRAGLHVDMLPKVVTHIQEGYKTMAFDNPAYHALFELLLKNDGAVYFHCSMGKDRTGVGAFLIMMALGMKEDDGMKEYLRSNDLLRGYNEGILTKLPLSDEEKKYAKQLLYVQSENLQLTIASIKERYTSYPAFLEQEYGLHEQQRERLRSIYCE